MFPISQKIIIDEDLDLISKVMNSLKLKNSNSMLKIFNNKIYNCLKNAIYINKLRCKWLEIAKNDILKNNLNGIHLFEVRNNNNDP